MDIPTLMRTIADEVLTAPVFISTGSTRRQADAVVIERDREVWHVYVTGERASVYEKTRKTFSTESAALGYALEKLRQSAKEKAALEALQPKEPRKAFVWHPEVVQENGQQRIVLVGGASANHDMRRFTYPITDEQLERLQADASRRRLLWSALLPLCDMAGTNGPLDEDRASELTQAILFGSVADIEQLFKEITWDLRWLLAHGARLSMLERGKLLTAVQSSTDTAHWGVVQEYNAMRRRVQRGVVLSPLDEALLKYTDLYVHGGRVPIRKPEAVDLAILPNALAVITTAEQAAADTEFSVVRPDNSSDQTLRKQEWQALSTKVTQAVRAAHPKLHDDAIEAVSFLMSAEAADRARSR